MAVSDFVLDIAKLIKEKSGVDFNVDEESTKVTEEWIPENELSKMEVIQLRTAQQTGSREAAKLKQFNPSYFLKEPDENRCRVHGCSAATAPRGPTHTSGKMKQDLLLCEAHHAELTNLVSKRCAEAGITVNVASYNDEDFIGYTSLIAILEGAFAELKKKSYRPHSTTTDSTAADFVVLAEVFLNSRNCLSITNALLNPEKNNEKTVLGCILGLLEQILALPLNLVGDLVVLFGEVISTVFSYFGIVLEWVELLNPGAKLGAGLGLAGGFAVAALGALSPWMIAAYSVVGTISGYLVGSGVYGFTHPEKIKEYHERILTHRKMVFEHFEKKLPRGSTVFYVKGNDDGEIWIEMKKNLD